MSHTVHVILSPGTRIATRRVKPATMASGAGAEVRRKRPGPFWTRLGLCHLDASEEARDNGHWDELC
jgi:hypothetical protein